MPEPSAADQRFDACLDEVLRQEGGYADDPADPGGATNMGITRKTLAGWRQVSPWWKLPKSEVMGVKRPEAARLYRALYWNRCQGDALPPGLDLSLFDFAVNAGPDRAIKTLQTLLGVPADGMIGPLTLAAIARRNAAAGPASLIEALSARRLGFLLGLSTAIRFGSGWRRRVTRIRAAALAMAGASSIPSSQPQKGTASMSFNFLAGYKTYIVAAAMLLTGAAGLLGIDIPSFTGHAPGSLVMEALAFLFLRQGLKTGN
jgi:lysozyme family protein